MNQKVMMVVEFAVIYAAIFAFQKHVVKIPGVGAYLPGGQ